MFLLGQKYLKFVTLVPTIMFAFHLVLKVVTANGFGFVDNRLETCSNLYFFFYI
jgi:hypothetical protein